MSARLPNRILREMVDIHYFGGRDGLAVRRQLEDLCSQQFNRAIEETLESWGVPNNQVAAIDRLQIDVDAISIQNLESQLIPKIVAALKTELLAKIGPPGRFKTGALRHIANSVFEELLFFLEHGYLPWSTDSGPEWSKAAAQVLTEFDATVHQALIERLKNPDIRRRFIHHFPQETLNHILTALWTDAERKTLLADIGAILVQLRHSPVSPTLQARWLDLLIKHAIASHAQATTLQICESLVKELDQYDPHIEFTNFAASITIKLPALLQSLKQRAQPNHELGADSPQSAVTDSEDTRHSDVTQRLDVKPTPTERDDTTVDLPLQKVPPTKTAAPIRHTDRKGKAMPDTESIYIRNAGLVILASYLPALFRKLELLEDRTIRDVSTALSLTHYLVFATDQCAEWELVLNKILCGIPLRSPVETGHPLLPEEKAEADRLLSAVIANWPVLKNTSATGLRNTFLQREGVLRLEGRNWQLRLTRTAFDVLMDQLPWTISMTQLPWMPSMLQTDWAS